MDAHLEVIDAFVDGERVDPAALKNALADPAGRDYFVDVWAIREAVVQDPASRVAGPPATFTASKRTAPLWTIAAALVAGVVGGYVAAYRPAAPASPATPPAITSVAEAPDRAVVPVPAATRVIQLEFQADPRRNGGN